jgi:hypothetical protein
MQVNRIICTGHPALAQFMSARASGASMGRLRALADAAAVEGRASNRGTSRAARPRLVFDRDAAQEWDRRARVLYARLIRLSVQLSTD